MIKIQKRARKVSKSFAEQFLDEIKLKRVQSGIDKKFMSDARITEGLLKDSEISKEMLKIKDRLIKMPNKENLR